MKKLQILAPSHLDDIENGDLKKSLDAALVDNVTPGRHTYIQIVLHLDAVRHATGHIGLIKKAVRLYKKKQPVEEGEVESTAQDTGGNALLSLFAFSPCDVAA